MRAFFAETLFTFLCFDLAPDVDECQNPSSCISPATCKNTDGSYFCECPTGYVFKAGSNKECQGITDANETRFRGPSSSQKEQRP